VERLAKPVRSGRVSQPIALADNARTTIEPFSRPELGAKWPELRFSSGHSRQAFVPLAQWTPARRIGHAPGRLASRQFLTNHRRGRQPFPALRFIRFANHSLPPPGPASGYGAKQATGGGGRPGGSIRRGPSTSARFVPSTLAVPYSAVRRKSRPKRVAFGHSRRLASTV
jgi:hypothetical protein